MSSDGSSTTTDSSSIVVPDLKSDESLLASVERLLNRSNLQTDAYLVSKMKEEMHIPLDALAQAPGLLSFREAPSSQQELVERLRTVLAKSTQVSLSADQNSVRPNFSIQRHTIIIRDIPSSTPPEEIRNLLPETHRTKISNIHCEVGNNWFVSFESESDAVDSLAIIRRSKFNGQTVHARLKAESLLRGTPSVRSARPPSGPAAAPSSTTESPAPPTNLTFHTAPTHTGFYSAGVPSVAKSAVAPTFPQYYPPTAYYQHPSWYYSGANMPIHDPLLPPTTQQFTSSPAPLSGSNAATPAHFPSPSYTQTPQSHPLPQSGFESSQPSHPATSPRSRPSSTGTQYSSRKTPSSAPPGSGPSQPRGKLSSGPSSAPSSTGGPAAKRRPRNPSLSTNAKSGEAGHHSSTSHPAAGNKKRNPRGAAGSRGEDGSSRHSESHAQKPVSLGIQNFPPLASSTPAAAAPAASVTSSWTKEGVTLVKSVPSAKQNLPPPQKPAPVQPTPEAPQPQPAPVPAPVAITPVAASPLPAPTPVSTPFSSSPQIASLAVGSPVLSTPVVTPPISTPITIAPPSQNAQQTSAKPLWASIAARAPPPSGQH